MKITDFPVCNDYRRKSSWYHPTRGHTGVDMLFNYHTLESPVNGTVVRIATQTEMGLCLYLKDEKGNIHVFAHLYRTYFFKGARVRKGNTIVQCGNTGTKSSQPHLHYEIITPKPLNSEDKTMVRKLWEFSGYNTDPTKYLLSLELDEPDWIGKLAKAPEWLGKKIKSIPYPKWLN